MKVSNVISFISGVLSIFVFITGYQKIGDIINNNEIENEKKIEISRSLNKENSSIAFEVSADVETVLETKGDSTIVKINSRECDEISMRVKKNFLEDYNYFVKIGNIKIRKSILKQYDQNDSGTRIGEVQITGIINYHEKQYIYYLFGKLPYNSIMKVHYFGVGYLLN